MHGRLILTLLPRCTIPGSEPGTSRQLETSDILKTLTVVGYTVAAVSAHEIVAWRPIETLEHFEVFSRLAHLNEGLPIRGVYFLAISQPFDWRDYRREALSPPVPQFPRRATIRFG